MSTAGAISYPTDLSATKTRVSSIDLMRGIVMVVMALDHTRDFFHKGALFYDATNLETTTPALFFTRWITHYCAPTFVFLAGTSIFLNSFKKDKKELSLFLISRGLWIIFIEVVIWRFSFLFNFYYDITFLQVLWAIGASMIIMAALIRLPLNALIALGLLITFGHNVLLMNPVDMTSPLYILMTVMEQGGALPIDDQHVIVVAYPILPWLGIMILGYCLGSLYRPTFNVVERKRILLRLGIGFTMLFILLRYINVYGDPSAWASQHDALFTVMSFLNCTKYPPSLLYSLMTLGPMLIFLSFLERGLSNLFKPLEIFGRVPMFYYILHFYFLHAAALLLEIIDRGTPFSSIDFHVNKTFGGLTADSGYSLTITYLAWILVVLLLYPLCRWYNRYKKTHHHWWLGYL